MITNFSKKRNRDFFNNDLLFKTVGIIFIIVIIILIISDFRIYQKKRQLNAEIKTYKEQIREIENRGQTLKNEIVNSNNIDYLEKLGYEQFDQTRPGETEYMFIDSTKETEVAPIKKDNRWLNWFNNFSSWLKSIF
ncbi:MAG: septum formation initiator family protein [Candidatus Staskawiczbacteria bacterium]